MTTVQTRIHLRVTSVRSRGPRGGAIFAGKDQYGEPSVVKADYRLLPDSSVVQIAQVWDVAGTQEAISYEHQGSTRTELQIVASSLALQRPSGRNIVSWIAKSPECKGVGEVKARKLFERFGLQLIQHIEDGDVDLLAEVVDYAAADALVSAFANNGIGQTLVWLEQVGFPRKVAEDVARYWGKNARTKVEANPYVLISFCADWKTVDTFAQKAFGVRENDPRRLLAAAEEVVYGGMDKGDTALHHTVAKERLAKLLGRTGLAVDALADAVADGKVIEDGDLVQAAGLGYVENMIARTLASMVAGEFEGQDELFVAGVPSNEEASRHLAVYESLHGIELTPEQRRAVINTTTSRVSLILGGAGTGKTTVLKGVCHVLERIDPGVQIHQFALAGRAAQRMSQSTGRPASTLAAFLSGSVSVSPSATVLIDEVSMVDVLLMYRVLKQLPVGVRFVLIGDPAQLPPIGPGLVLHALDGLEAVPQTTLKTVKRQSSASGIPQVAQAVREHRVPSWAAYTGQGNGVSAIQCSEAELDQKVLEIYGELGGDGTDYSVQILSTTKNGAGGVKSLNRLIHEQFAAGDVAVQSLDPEYGIVLEKCQYGLPLFPGDLVMFGSNDYTLGLRNGSLGTIVTPVTDSNASFVCQARFEDALYALTAAHIKHVSHAYAITVHKSQGSQFDRVIVPLRSSKLLDNALIYTAITRGVSQVVLVGDIAAAEAAIRGPSNSSRRTTRLGKALARHAPIASTTRGTGLPVSQLECP